jgi:hypothetical protein
MRKPRERRRQTLGAGAYESRLNGEDEPSTKDAQGLFLEAVRRLAPGIVEELSEEPFALYKQIPELCFNADKERLAKFRRLNIYDRVRERYLWQEYRRPSWRNIEIRQWFSFS